MTQSNERETRAKAAIAAEMAKVDWTNGVDLNVVCIRAMLAFADSEAVADLSPNPDAPNLTDAQWQAAVANAPKPGGPLTPIPAPLKMDAFIAKGARVVDTFNDWGSFTVTNATTGDDESRSGAVAEALSDVRARQAAHARAALEQSADSGMVMVLADELAGLRARMPWAGGQSPITSRSASSIASTAQQDSAEGGEGQ